MCPGRPAACCRMSVGAAAEFGDVGQERHRIEIALDRAVGADHPPGIVQPHAPVDADDRRARLRPTAATAAGCRWRN